MLASVSCKPCFFRRSANSRYPTSARASSALRNRLARSSQNGFAAIGILPHLHNIYYMRYFPIECRVHEALRTTPAMALGLTDSRLVAWRLIDAALAVASPDATETAPERRRKFRVIQG